MAIFKKEKVALDMQSISTLISEGCVIDGNLKAPAFARIDGQISGDVMIDEGLIVGEKASIRGNVITKELVVYGTIVGNVQAISLEIRATGHITGDIRTQTLGVEQGAVYDGNLSMSQNPKLAQSNPTKNKPEPELIEV
ncbi:MAG: bactofilin family protein [Mucilaginibacter sp.]